MDMLFTRVTRLNGRYSRVAMLLLGLGLFAAAFGQPVLNSPANNATGLPIANDTLKWTTNGATSYHVELSTDSTFATITVLNDSGIVTNVLATGALINNTTYYWRVSSKTAGINSAFSAHFAFTTIVATPIAPSLTSPANLATGVAITNDTLKWGAVTGAATYRVQFGTDSTFATTLVNDSTPTTGARATGALTNNTVYYWRVNAKNAGGTSAYSTRFSFTTIIAAPIAPTLISPVNLATGMAITNDTLKWGAVTGAATYRVQFGTDSTFATTLVNDSTPTTGARATGTLTNNTVYYWRVNAKNAGGTSAYSTRFSFVTIVAVPVAPTLTSPANLAAGVAITNDTLKWGAVTGAATYQVQFGTDSTFATTLVNDSTPTAAMRATGPLTNLTVYYWRVNAKNAGGTSAYSARFSFTTVLGIPTAPALGSPANLATNVASFPTLKWTPTSNGVTSYNLQLSVDSNFSSPASMLADDSGLTADTLVVGPIADNLVYYWRVSAKNSLGTSPFSARNKFTTGNNVAGISQNSGPSMERLSMSNDVLRFFLPARSLVSITLYDSQGRMQETLLNADKDAGNYTLSLNAAKLSGASFLDFRANGIHRTLLIH